MPPDSKYGWRGLAGDATGGFIAALVALPYGLALAKLMGLPPELGLFTSIVTAPVTSLLGRNPVLIGGTASATVPFIAAAVHAQGVGGAAKVCLAASVFMMIFAAVRLGRYVARVPHAVVSGFSCGVGAMMVILQLRMLLGLPASPSATSDSPLGQLAQVLSNLNHARWEPLLLGTIVVAGAILTARRWPRSPAALLGVALAVAIGYGLGWHERVLGDIHLTMPSIATFAWARSDLTDLLPNALGLAFVSSVNILITSRVVEHFRGRHHHLRPADADRELGAYGIANLCAGIFGASHERRHPGPEPGEYPLRRNDSPLESSARRLSAHSGWCWLGIDFPNPPGSPGRRDRIRGPEPPRVEHLAPVASDAAGRRNRVSDDGPGRLDDQRRGGRRNRLLVVLDSVSPRQAGAAPAVAGDRDA